ncbi:MAG: hypothetical protein CUN55_17050 [Phototrophicales bacterium]|nr:MAG: hypothetical protein CUN55_17050 [Phototrophicales bacterium]
MTKLEILPPVVLEGTAGTPRRVELIEGLIVDYYCDDAIGILYIYRVNRTIVDTFVEVCKAYAETRRAVGQPLLYSLVIKTFTLTPYMNRRSEELIELFKDMYGRAAYVLEVGLYRVMLRNFIALYYQKGMVNVEFHVVKSAEEALRWLYEGYTEWQAQNSH